MRKIINKLIAAFMEACVEAVSKVNDKCKLSTVLLCVCNCVNGRRAAVPKLTANSGANWLRYGAARTTNMEDGKASVEFEPSSHNIGSHRSCGSPSLAVELMRTFISYFASSAVLMLGYSLICFVNPFLLK